VSQLIDALLRWIYGWNSPPAELMNDLAELANNPAERLAKGPVVIGPMRTSRAYAGAILAVLLCGWTIVSGINDWNEQMGKKGVAIGVLLLVALVWGISRLRGVRHSQLTFDLNGVEFQNANSRLTCPWGLFNAVGAPVQSTMPHAITMPINPAAISLLSLKRADLTQESGTDVKSSEFKFAKTPDSVELSLLCAVDTLTIGQLLLSSGRALSTPDGAGRPQLESAARQTSAPSARMASLKPSATYTGGEGTAELRGRGRIIMDSVRTVFPPICCVCGQPTDEALPVEAVTRYLGFFSGSMVLNCSVPSCGGCQKRVRQREWLGRGIIVAICLAAGILGGRLLFGEQGWKRLLELDGPFLLIVAVIGLVMLKLLGRYGRELVSPIKARYLPRAEKVSFQFSQPGYAEKVSDFARNPNAWEQPAEMELQS
jgi:hypothetical protein